MDDDDEDDDDVCSDSLRSGVDSDSAADSPAPVSRGDGYHANSSSDVCRNSPLRSSPFLAHQKDELSHNMDKILDFHEGTKLFMDLPKLSSLPVVPNSRSQQPSVHATQIST